MFMHRSLLIITVKEWLRVGHTKYILKLSLNYSHLTLSRLAFKYSLKSKSEA